MVAPAQVRPTLGQPRLTPGRSDNDMYHHLNNSIYYFLHVRPNPVNKMRN
jgi:hypothetical protein